MLYFAYREQEPEHMQYYIYTYTYVVKCVHQQSIALYWIRMCAQNLIVFVQIIGRFIHSTNQKLFVNKKSRNRAAAAAIAVATPLAPITQKCVGRKCVWTDVHAHICKMVCLYTLTH